MALLIAIAAVTACEGKYWVPTTAVGQIDRTFTIDSEVSGGEFDVRHTVDLASIVDQLAPGQKVGQVRASVIYLLVEATPESGSTAGVMNVKFVSEFGDLTETTSVAVTQPGQPIRQFIHPPDVPHHPPVRTLGDRLADALTRSTGETIPVEIGAAGSVTGGRFVGQLTMRIQYGVSFRTCEKMSWIWPSEPELDECS